MEYVTRDGVRLEVGRVDRRELDAIYIPVPVPPSRVVETWGGVKEEIPDRDDPDYRIKLFDYHLRLGRELLDALALGLTIIDTDLARERIDALEQVIGKQDDLATGLLRYGISDAERVQVVELLLYQSTVTQRGIDEAAERFGYKWRGKPLTTWHIPGSHGERGKLAVEWRAANRSGIPWTQFCDLPGPEQSQHVAFWMLEDKLMYLLQQN
jgi:hypothetical protein